MKIVNVNKNWNKNILFILSCPKGFLVLNKMDYENERLLKQIYPNGVPGKRNKIDFKNYPHKKKICFG